MKLFQKFICLFSVILCGLTISNSLGAPCNPTFNQGSYVTVAYCSTGTCSSTTVSVSWNTTDCYGLADPTWELTSNGVDGSALGLEWGGSASCSTVGSTRTCTRTIRCKNQNFMKGQVRVRWQGVCGIGGEIVRSIDVFKTFTSTDLNTQTSVDEPGQATFYIAGSSCAKSNERLAFAVRPYVTNPASDMIGQDRYYWGIGSFTALSPTSVNPTYASALIVKAPSTMPSSITITVRLGQENSGTHASLVVNKRPNQPAINLGGSWPTGSWVWSDHASTNTMTKACMNSTFTGSFTLYLFNGESDVNYNWTWPEGFTPTTATSGTNVTSVTFTANTDGKVGAGRFTCTANGGQCGNLVGSLDVRRVLNSGYSITPTTPTCLTGGTSYTYALTGSTANVPINQDYEWAYPGGWTVTGSASGPTIVLTPPLNGAGGAVSVKPAVSSFNSSCSTSVSTGPLSVQGQGSYPVYFYRADSTTRTFAAQVASGGSSLNYPGCSESDFSYSWSYRGRFTNSGGTATNWPSSLGSPCTDSWHTAPGSSPGATDPFANGNGSQTMTLKTGTYAAHPSCTTESAAKLRLVVQSITSCACYYSVRIRNVPATLSRPGKGGDAQNSLKVEDLNHTLELIPNPSSGKTMIRLGQIGDTPLRIRDMQGRIVHEVKTPAKEQSVDLKALPRGIYQVEYFDGTEMLSGLLRLE